MKLIVSILILIALTLSLTSCEVYNDGIDLGSAVDECQASGGNCVEASGAGLLSLFIQNPDPYYIKNTYTATADKNLTTERTFDIAGLCNEADFSENFIEYTILDSTTEGVLVGTVQLFNACKRGQFRFQVFIPTYLNITQLIRIRVELVGKDLNGNEFRNPLAAQRRVDVISI